MNTIVKVSLVNFMLILCGHFSFAKKSSEMKFPLSVQDSNVILPPSWAFGYLYGAYTNQVQTEELVKEIIAHDYPIDAFWIDS